MEAGTGAGIGAATGWGTFLIGVGSSRGIGVTFNFPGALPVFALIAYRLFWNQFQTYNKPLTLRIDSKLFLAVHNCNKIVLPASFALWSFPSFPGTHYNTKFNNINSNWIKRTKQYVKLWTEIRYTWTSLKELQEFPEMALHCGVLAKYLPSPRPYKETIIQLIIERNKRIKSLKGKKIGFYFMSWKIVLQLIYAQTIKSSDKICNIYILQLKQRIWLSCICIAH